MKEARTISRKRRLWRAAGWFLVLAVAAAGWAGWRVYDYRAAVREAKSLEWEWKSIEPWEVIREDWRAAFRRETWQRGAELTVPKESAGRVDLIRRLNPKVLNITGAADLARLQGLSDLEEMYIESETLTDLSGLRNLPRLAKLGFSHCERLQDLSGLRNVKTLEELTMIGCPSVQSILEIGDLPKLTYLRLENVSFRGFTGIQRNAALRSLLVYDCPNLGDLKGVAAFSGLETLEIWNCAAFHNLEGLSGMDELVWLHVIACQQLADVGGLDGAPQLHDFELTDCPMLQNFEPLRGLSDLRGLSLNLCAGLRDLEVIAGMSHLERLRLFECPNSENFEAIKGLTLQELWVVDCAKITEETKRELEAKVPIATFGTIGPIDEM